MAYKIVQAFCDKAKTIKKYYVSAFESVFNKEGKNLDEVCDEIHGDIEKLSEKMKNVTGTDLSKPLEEPVEAGEPFVVDANNVTYDSEAEYREGSIGRNVKEMQASIGRADAIYDDYINAQNLM